MTDDFAPGPPLPRCPACGRRAPRRGPACVLCEMLGNEVVCEDAVSRGFPAAPTTATELQPGPPPPGRENGGAPPPATAAWLPVDGVFGRPHPIPSVEAEARRRAGPPPTHGNALRWRIRLDQHRDDAERDWNRDEPRRDRERRFAEAVRGVTWAALPQIPSDS